MCRIFWERHGLPRDFEASAAPIFGSPSSSKLQESRTLRFKQFSIDGELWVMYLFTLQESATKKAQEDAEAGVV